MAKNVIEKLYPELVQLSRDEHAAWVGLCQALVAAGAVTEADLKARTADNSTSGGRLLNQIRRWGALSAAIAVEAHR